jgi:hypothetical protein
MNQFLDNIEKYFSIKKLNVRGRKFIYANNILSRNELGIFLKKKRDELERNKIKYKSDGFGMKTIHDLTLFLNYYDEENKNELHNSEFQKVNQIENNKKQSNNQLVLFEEKIINTNLFKTYLDNFYNNGFVTKRTKKLLDKLNINNFKDLETFLKSSQNIYKLKGFGTKSQSDLNNLHLFLIKNYFESDSESKKNELDIINKNVNKDLYEEINFHEDLFNIYIEQFYDNKDVTVRSKNLLKDFNIKNLVHLKNLLDSKEKLFILKGYGLGTIIDLENLYIFISSKYSELTNKNVNNERVLFYNIINYYDVDDDSLLLASQKKLNIFNFISKYFDIIFSNLSTYLLIILKYNIGFTLLDSEKKIFNSLTNKEIGSLNRRFFKHKFILYKEKIIKLLELSDQKLEFNQPYIIFNDEVLKYKNEDLFNYKFYLFIYFIFNDNYNFINLLNTRRPDIYEKSYKLFEINNILFYKKNCGFENLFNLLTDSIESLLNKKYYSESIIFNNINSEKYLIDKESIIKYIININNYSDSIIYDQGVLKNKKLPHFIDIVEMAIKYYNDLSTIEMIQNYIKGNFPSIKFNIEKIRITILNNKHKFFNLGKTGKYGLVNENYNYNIQSNDKSQGFKSMRSLITELLVNLNKPLHVNTIIKNLSSKFNTLNIDSLKRIILDTIDFENIGQSFIILRESGLGYDLPIQHNKIDTYLFSLNKLYNINTNWIKTDILINYFKKYKVPSYQIEYIFTSDLFVYQNKSTSSFEKYISDDIIELLEDRNIEKVLKDIYENTSITNKIQIRKNLKKYIQSEYHFTILEEDIQKLINFHK